MKTLEEPASDLGALQALVVDNPELERLEVLLGQFNIFEALGAVRQEVRHSDFLAFLLDPAENHGLGDEFARRLLQRILSSAGAGAVGLSPIDLDIWSLDALAVEREWHDIDILLLDEPHRLAVVIENKIGCVEHSDQLARYFKAATQRCPGWKIVGIYLTPDAEPPSHECYIAADYLSVCQIVEKLIESRSSTIGADVRTMMVHYAQMLRRHIVSESEIAELCQRIYRKHQRALDLIYEHRPDQQASIREGLEELINSGPGLQLDHCSKSYIRFAPREWDVPRLMEGSGWTKTGRILVFEFTNVPNRLHLRLHIGPGPNGTRTQLFQMAQSHSVFRLGSKSLNQKWNSIYDKPFLTPKDFEDASNERLGAEVAKHWKKFTETDLPAILEAVREEQWPWEKK
jgi:hypothetical protein